MENNIELDPRIQALTLKLLCDGHTPEKIKDLIQEKYETKVALADIELIAKANAAVIEDTKEKRVSALANRSLRESLDRVAVFEKQANIYERALREFDGHDTIKIQNIHQYMKIQERWLSILDQIATEMGVKKAGQLNVFVGDKLISQLVDKLLASKTKDEVYTDIDKLREVRDAEEGEIVHGELPGPAGRENSTSGNN